jgi:hypothetical protein
MTRATEITLWDEITESTLHILGELVFVLMVILENVICWASDQIDKILLPE